jgi:hypothetical protein
MKTTTKQIITGLALIGAMTAGGQTSAQTLQLTTPMDGSMSCEQLTAEVARMEQAMGAANATMASADGAARAANLGATIGVEAALRSGALARMPGLGRFASMASNAAQTAAANRAQEGAQAIQVAQQRRAIMSGLYQGKGCGATPTVTPASMSVTTTTTAAPTALSATQDMPLRASAAPTAAIVGNVKSGGAVYATGNRNGVWMEVDDENGSRGWMSSAFTKPR